MRSLFMLACAASLFLVSSVAAEVLQAGFVTTAGVYNSELMAPYDVLEHTRYRDEENYILCSVITEDGKPFSTSEGITITPHFSFETAPALDIVILPSSEHSMREDLANDRYIDYLKRVIVEADWVMSLCDGAFPLAQTGALNGLIATTFPGDRDAFAAKFPQVEVLYDVRFVVDGKFITSVGGAPSYEPAFWLVEHLYGKEHAERTGQGLVVEWNLDDIAHRVVDR